MTDFQEELWWQNLEEWIFDESQVVTYKYLAANLNIHVNSAKRMLFTFHDQKKGNNKTKAIYVISGLLDDQMHVKLVTEDDLKQEEKKLKKGLSKHIFALYDSSMKCDLQSALFGEKVNSKKVNDEIIPHRSIQCEKSQSRRPLKIQVPFTAFAYLYARGRINYYALYVNIGQPSGQTRNLTIRSLTGNSTIQTDLSETRTQG